MNRPADVTGLIAKIYEAALAPELWPAALDQLGEAFGGSSVLFGVQKLRSGPGFVALARLDPACGLLFRSFHADPKHNLSIREMPNAPVATPHLATDVPWRDEFLRSEAFEVLLRPQTIQDSALMSLVRETDHFVALSLMQPQGAGPFGEPERSLLQVLVPHLRRAAQVMLRLGTLQTQVHALEDALDRLPLGVVLVDAQGAVIELNRTAAHIVAAGDGLRVERDGLVATSARATRELRRLIAGAAATGSGKGTGPGGVLALDRPSGGSPLALLVASLAREPPASGRGSAAIVFVADPEQTDQPPEAVLRRLYGLTRAEAALAAQLLAGKELAEIAEDTAVSMNTLRTHLKAIFAKTGAQRQTELLRLLLRGPAGLVPG